MAESTDPCVLEGWHPCQNTVAQQGRLLYQHWIVSTAALTNRWVEQKNVCVLDFKGKKIQSLAPSVNLFSSMTVTVHRITED